MPIIGYGVYQVSKDDVEKLEQALNELEDLAAFFYEDFENSSIDFLFRRFGKSSLKQRTKRFVKRGVKKVLQTFLGKKGLEQLKKKMRG